LTYYCTNINGYGGYGKWYIFILTGVMKNPNILVCPLDWGLGHAARCVPIIRELYSQGAIPIIAADRGPLELLQKEFPELEHICFPGVSVTYPSQGESMIWSMLKQSTALLKGISEETEFIKKLVQERQIHAVVSDNRFGAYSNKIPSVYITHQIHIQTGHWLTDALARKQHAHYMKNFQTVWIPDREEKDNLSGKLSHGTSIPVSARYIGLLSRFHFIPDAEKKYDVAFILSGPEPQRSIFEDQVLKEIDSYPDKNFVLVRGKNETISNLPKNITCIPLATTKTIQELYAQSDQIICRSGYTSIMEMVSVGRSAWLIPTPGQTEQEYLADYLAGRMGFKTMTQDTLSLHQVLQDPIPCTRYAKHDDHLLKEVISELLYSIKKANP
jgi:hypothetical protein